MDIPQFTQDIKDKWLEALKSGQYVQGIGKLVQATPDGVKHCCLGVLCEIHPELNVEINQHRDVPLYAKGEETEGYNVFRKMFKVEPIVITTITDTNDTKFDGKYTAVISLIEALFIKN